MTERHVVVVGGGITGLAAAHALVTRPDGPRVTVLEAGERLGGKIATSAFAGLPAVDEGADAFLTRVPWAGGLARAVGLGEALTSPATGSAAIWQPARAPYLHPIPAGLVLGVPSGSLALARSHLLSWRGKARAAIEPLLPRRRTDGSVGALIRSRFGDEVEELLVDPLIGSIYAADTDRMDMCAVPQVQGLAAKGRSLLLATRAVRREAAAAPAGPVFEAPVGGMAAFVDAVAARVRECGGDIRTGVAVTSITRVGEGYEVQPTTGGPIAADAVILATPAPASGALVADVAPEAAALLRGWDYASVVMITMAVPGLDGRLQGSGYLVPKPVQRRVTAASFASNKWAHLRPPTGEALLRVSIGRDGAPPDDLDDAAALQAALDEVGEHLGLGRGSGLQPTDVRITRWANAFPQYRPGHPAKVAAVGAALRAAAPGIAVAGAAYDGIGIPACIRQGQEAAAAVCAATGTVRE
jgi:oxygen-dependent protoporphyrinogen oxidase